MLTVPVTLSFRRVRSSTRRSSSREPDGDASRRTTARLGVTFVRGPGRILVHAECAGVRVDPSCPSVAGSDRGGPPARERARIDRRARAAVRRGRSSPMCLVQLQPETDGRAVVAYVHDNGGGLVMVGGPDSFGAGGWIGSPLADALPVRLDPPSETPDAARRARAGHPLGGMPRVGSTGASRSSPRASVDERSAGSTSSGRSEWSFAGQADVGPYGIAREGDIGGRQARDQQPHLRRHADFDARRMRLTQQGLQRSTRGRSTASSSATATPCRPGRHSAQPDRNAGITISTVASSRTGAACGTSTRCGASPSDGRDLLLRQHAGAAPELPKIFIKEAQVVRRTLIREGEPVPPRDRCADRDHARVHRRSRRSRGTSSPPTAEPRQTRTLRAQRRRATRPRGPDLRPVAVRPRAASSRSPATPASRWASSVGRLGGLPAVLGAAPALGDAPIRLGQRARATQTDGETTEVIVTASTIGRAPQLRRLPGPRRRARTWRRP